jgi:uncharacterized membrane protein
MNTDEPKDDHKEILNTSLTEGMEEFREEVQKYRLKIWNGDQSYEQGVIEDKEYRELLEKADLTEGDKEVYLKKYRARAELAKKLDAVRFGLEDEDIEEIADEEELEIAANLLGEDEGEEDAPEFLKIGKNEKVPFDVAQPSISDAERYKWKSNSAHFKKEKTVQEQIQEIIEAQRKDFENYLGSNLAGKVGILMMIIGFIIGVNYGISTGLIGQVGIIVIGFAVGSGLLVAGHRVHDKNPAVTTTLVTIGIWVMYFTVYKLYTYLNLESGMLMMAYLINFLVTVLSMAMAMYYKREPLALLSVIAAYITPLFVGNSVEIENFYAFLFAYLLLMNIGMMYVANIMEWRTVNMATFAASFLILSVWILFLMNPENDLAEALWFSTLYFVAFYVMNIVYTLQPHNPLAKFNRQLLFANTVFYIVFILKINIHADTGAGTMGLFYLFQSVLSSIYAYILYHKQRLEEHEQLFEQLLLFSIIFFNWSLFLIFDLTTLNFVWSLEAPIIIYLGLRTRIEVLNQASLVLTLMSLASMFIGWFKSYTNPFLDFMMNDAVLHTLISVSSIAIMLAIIARERHLIVLAYENLKQEEGADLAAINEEMQEDLYDFEHQPIWFFNVHSYSDLLRTLLIFVVFLNGNIEFAVHTPSNFGGNDLRKLIWGIFNNLFILGLWGIAKRFNLANFKSNASFLIVLSVLAYFVMGTGSAVNLRNQYLMSTGDFFPFFMHYVAVLLGLFGYYLVVKDTAEEKGTESQTFSLLVYLGCVIVTAHLSIELVHLYVLTGYYEGVDIDLILSAARLVGFSLLWTLTAFGVVYAGMQMKVKELRMFGISLFVFVIFKFFAWDFWQIDKVGKIIGFMFIGAILVAVSSLYTRLQKMIIEGEISALTGEKPISEQKKEGESTKISPENPENSEQQDNGN